MKQHLISQLTDKNKWRPRWGRAGETDILKQINLKLDYANGSKYPIQLRLSGFRLVLRGNMSVLLHIKYLYVSNFCTDFIGPWRWATCYFGILPEEIYMRTTVTAGFRLNFVRRELTHAWGRLYRKTVPFVDAKIHGTVRRKFVGKCVYMGRWVGY